MSVQNSYKEASEYLENIPKFIKKNTMQQTRDFYEYMGKKIHFMIGNKPLVYVSTEGESAIKEWEAENAFAMKIRKPEQPDNTDKKGEEFEAMKKKMKTTIIASVVGVVVLIVSAIIYKATR